MVTQEPEFAKGRGPVPPCPGPEVVPNRVREGQHLEEPGYAEDREHETGSGTAGVGARKLARKASDPVAGPSAPPDDEAAWAKVAALVSPARLDCDSAKELAMLSKNLFTAAAAAALALLLSPVPALAHCDTLDGPVVKDARRALEAKDVTPVLKWVKPEQEKGIREVFAQVLEVRAQGAKARGLADRLFFETLVRIHREGEGAPYTGLKPAGMEIAEGIAGADAALETGSVDALVKTLTHAVEHGVRERFATAAEARKHLGENVDKGRQFVAAYVEFMHYAERIHQDASTRAADSEHGHQPATGTHRQQ